MDDKLKQIVETMNKTVLKGKTDSIQKKKEAIPYQAISELFVANSCSVSVFYRHKLLYCK